MRDSSSVQDITHLELESVAREDGEKDSVVVTPMLRSNLPPRLQGTISDWLLPDTLDAALTLPPNAKEHCNTYIVNQVQPQAICEKKVPDKKDILEGKFPTK